MEEEIQKYRGRNIFLPQYVLKTNCEPKDDLREVKTCVVLYNKHNFVFFGQRLIFVLSSHMFVLLDIEHTRFSAWHLSLFQTISNYEECVSA
jgi:hypothetical protein